MTCAQWLRVFSVLSLFVMLTAPRAALARTPGPVPTPLGAQDAPQPPLSPASDGRLHVVYAHQTLDLKVVDNAAGELYVDFSDPGLATISSLHGITVRWSDGTPKTATVYGGGHYLHWAVGARRGLVDGHDASWGVPAVVERDGCLAVSVRALAQFLDFRLRPLEGADGTFQFVARLEKLELHATSDREITVQASGPLEDAQIATVGRTTTVRLVNVEWAFEERSFQFGDVAVQCAGAGTITDPATISVTVPEQWKTECTGRLLQNQLSIRVLPEFQAEANRRPENLANLRHFKGIGDFYVMLDATGPIQQVWRYDASHRLLTIDVPQAVVGDLTTQLDAEIERVETEDMRTATFPFARIRVFVKEGCGFEVKVGDDNRLTVRAAPLVLLPISSTCGGDVSTMHYGRGFIVIDPGHGGADPGAINKAMGLCEKDVTLDISKRLKGSLELRGFRVVMTREDDRDVSWAHSPDGVELGARVNVANSRNADLFVSIHCNSAVSSEHKGTSYHWFKPQDLPLARALEGSLMSGTGFSNHGLIRNRFYVLRRTTMPAVLVETAFLSNPSEAARLADPQIRQKIADNIAEALSVKFAASGASRQQGISTRRP